MKILVIYYSGSGATEKAAEFVAKETGASIEAITVPAGKIGFIKAGYEATFGKCAKICAVKSKIEEYDVVIIGTPVWAGKISSPVNAFLSGFGEKIKNYAVILTRASKENDYASVTGIFSAKLKKEPLAFLSMQTQTANAGDFSAAREFVKTINELSAK